MGLVEEATAPEGGAGMAEIAGIVTVGGVVLAGMAEGKVLLVRRDTGHTRFSFTCLVYPSCLSRRNQTYLCMFFLFSFSRKGPRHF